MDEAILLSEISQKLLDSFRRYVEISAATYSKPCPHPPQGIEIVRYIDDKPTGTQGFIAKDEAANEAIVAFRGSDDLLDAITDLDFFFTPLRTLGVQECPNCLVHRGFLRSWNSVANETVNTVKELLDSNPDMKITITGQSLGGALASLATTTFRGLGFDVKTYTYGQPRTGNQQYADFVDDLTSRDTMFRVTHTNDGVPQAPPRFLGFRHHSTEYWQSVDEPIAAKTFRCVGQEPVDCNNSLIGIGINKAHTFYIGVSVGDLRDRGQMICNARRPRVPDESSESGSEGSYGSEDKEKSYGSEGKEKS
ncbi:hypothetical protein L249_7569 [Ophiocordyceps polyrhachis-furcata BCC 54312]|uniref:Fungal lipase-type domain-containing protein n=1 Tax=Ophiocordyceps polyrhachis-furcata BCC 54312 TaxID=1330021 RepID=A0A367LAW1_9HYPO|nr:hypothetical protein L249_7569 [Ophiocordyceps polyrhachis-furcata BCC 54312]